LSEYLWWRLPYVFLDNPGSLSKYPH
jgi:hypothetical protein